ncbi:MAG: hypothetical protein K6F94_04265 [Bacteroidaceae bacterium]|nr:hypothetical protein [Bacteroidaceae bacterium]
MRILYFNPENDLALAANDPHYTPPASALQMASDLQRFPLRWALPGDIILLRDNTFIDTLGYNIPQYNQFSSDVMILPWGWSPLAVQQLRDAGIPDAFLPSDSEISAYRDYSSRKTAVRLLEHLRNIWPEPFYKGELVGESIWCEEETEVQNAVSEYSFMAMLKAPWSGSGRGVHPIKGRLSEKDSAWIRRTLQKQRGIEVEPLYQKVMDLALEFWSDKGKIHYEGLSLFNTTGGGVYNGNVIASEEMKISQLSHYISPKLLSEVKEHLICVLASSDIPSWYCGPLGIDMMIVSKLSEPSVFQIHPCVELNFRLTMGWVATRLVSTLRGGAVGSFSISYEGGRYRDVLVAGGTKSHRG